jgi:hypothetical protein
MWFRITDSKQNGAGEDQIKLLNGTNFCDYMLEQDKIFANGLYPTTKK